MSMNFFEMSQTGASVGSAKIANFEDAVNRLVMRLKVQHGYWKGNKGQDAFDAGEIKGNRGLWFKKMNLSNDYMLQLKIGQTPVYMSDEARKAKSAWVHNIPEKDMDKMMQSIIDQIESGDEGAMNILKRAYEDYKEGMSK